MRRFVRLAASGVILATAAISGLVIGTTPQPVRASHLYLTFARLYLTTHLAQYLRKAQVPLRRSRPEPRYPHRSTRNSRRSHEVGGRRSVRLHLVLRSASAARDERRG